MRGFPARRWGRNWKMAGLLAAVVLWPRNLPGHGIEFHEGTNWWLAWNFDLWITANLLLVGGAYALGLRRLWGKVGEGRGVSGRQALAFGAGWLAVAGALISPVDALSAEFSWVHMAQHMILMNLAAPLLVAGSPGVVWIWALPWRKRARIGTWMRKWEGWRPKGYLFWQMGVMWGMYAAALWIWHLPKLYQAALRNDFVHDLQHLSFLIVACLFWRVLLDPLYRYRISRGLGVIYLFGTSLHATVLGVYMALSPRVWYPDYEVRLAGWNLTALEDQQLAGLIMWMPACMVYAVAAAILFALWLQEPRRPWQEAEVMEEGSGP
jgi:putative membrane protein